MPDKDLGFFLSTDNGNSWTQDNYGLIDNHILSICISGDYVFVGTFYAGIFRQKISEITSDVTENNSNDKGIDLRVFYLNDMIRFEFKSKSQYYFLKIYDIKGNIVHSENGTSNFGHNSIDINKNTFNTGIYFCSIQSGNYTDTKKFLIIR